MDWSDWFSYYLFKYYRSPFSSCCLYHFISNRLFQNRNLSFKPERSSDSIIIQDEPIVRINPLFKQILYGDQYTEQTAYEWSDINIQGLIGDKVIDLSNTVLPDDTAVISIRHGVGNIVIYVPYDVEFSIQHSAAFGRAYILHKEHLDLLNQNVHYETGAYGNAISG